MTETFFKSSFFHFAVYLFACLFVYLIHFILYIFFFSKTVNMVLAKCFRKEKGFHYNFGNWICIRDCFALIGHQSERVFPIQANRSACCHCGEVCAWISERFYKRCASRNSKDAHCARSRGAPTLHSSLQRLFSLGGSSFDLVRN